MLGRRPVRGRRIRRISKALVLIEERHHVVHGAQRVVKLLRPALQVALSKSRQNLLTGYGQHHLIQHDLRGSQNTVLLIVFSVYLIVFSGCLVYLLVKPFLGGHVLVQSPHIIGHQLSSLLIVRNAPEIEHRLVGSAVYPHGVSVTGVISRIFDVKRAAALKGQALDGRYGHLVASHLKRGHLRGEGSRLRVILGGNQLKRGV